jgi:hypothetical protein
VKDIYEVLKQKESDCARLNEEVEALRLVVPLLKDQGTVANGAEELVLDPDPMVEEKPMVVEDKSILEEQETSNLKEGVSTEEIADADRKSPLSATLGESGWWRRRSR